MSRGFEENWKKEDVEIGKDVDYENLKNWYNFALFDPSFNYITSWLLAAI